MRRWGWGWGLVGVALVLGGLGCAGTPAGPPRPSNKPEALADSVIEIARFPYGYCAALSFTFDDGLQSQLDLAVPELERVGYRATFFLVPGRIREHRLDPPAPGLEGLGSWEEWRALAGRGHEIGNHTLGHLDLPTLTDPDELHRQVNDAADLIRAKVGIAPVSFAYPFSHSTEAVRWVVLARHIAERWEVTPYGGAASSAAQLNALVDHTITTEGWIVPILHGIGDGYRPLELAVFREHLHYLASIGVVWVAPYAEIFRYVAARDNTFIEVQTRTPASLTFRLRSSLDPTAFCVPLHLVITPQLPRPLSAARAQRADGGELPVRVRGTAIWVTVPLGSPPVCVTWK
jgi:peptidoglycan/xylan/chitin deacetylase (PgdA/CDA1 family)